MTKTIFLASLFLGLAIFHRLALAQVPDEGLPSPYFIDELHCSGINVHTIEEGWLLTAEEVEPARKIEQAEMCENLYRVFGISKYAWLSPDDLERTATLIRQSGYFAESDLSVKKSELKNHVHVYLKVKPNARFTESFANEFKMYSSSGQGSGRLYDSFSAEVTDHKYAPMMTNSYGINLMGTTARSPISADAGTLAPDDQQKSQMKDNYLADLYWKQQGAVSKYLSYDIGIHLDEDKTYSDGHSRFNFVTDGDILISKRVNIVNGVVFVGPAYIFTTYYPYQITPTTSGSGVFLPGLIFGYDYGHAFANYLRFKVGYYNSTKNQSVFQMNLDLQRHLQWIDSNLIFGFKERVVLNSVLPQDRYPLDGGNDWDEWIGLGKVFHGSEHSHQINAIAGIEHLAYNGQQPTYDAQAPYVGLRYKVVDGSWDISLAASYYFQRLY